MLVFCMVLTMTIYGLGALQVSAAEGDTHAHCVCGATHKNVGDHTAEQTVTWTAWDGTSSIIYTDKVAYVYLSADVELSTTLEIGADKTLYLCLNGHKLTPADGFTDGAIYILSNSATLVLTDCGEGGGVSGFNATNSGAGVYNYGTFIMYGGAISNNTTTSGTGGGVYNNGGTFTMNGGTISGNTGRNGGGVYNYGTNSTFTMNDGAISGNTVSGSYSSYGGGVYNKYGTFTMNGGTISNNTASSAGGGVYNHDTSSTFTMNGGTISGNTVSGSNAPFGGGVYSGGGTFTMNGGTISNNTASSAGGGVYNHSGPFTMNGGIVSNNTSANGGGIFNNVGTFTMYDGEISNNTVTYGGGGVYNSSGTFTMHDGTITSNTASGNTISSGGGVYNNGGTVTMHDGTISGNTVDGSNNYNRGGGIYTSADGKTATISGGIISGNKAYYGGGVFVYKGSLTVTDTEITGNTASYLGGGIAFDTYATVTLSGSTQITGNKKGSDNSNLCSIGTLVLVDLDEDARIGMHFSVAGEGNFATGGAAYADRFVSDNSDYTVVANGTLCLALKRLYTVTFDYGTLGSETKTVLNGDTVTPPAPVFPSKILVGWYTSSSFTTEFDFDNAITADTTVYAKFTSAVAKIEQVVSGGTTTYTITYTDGTVESFAITDGTDGTDGREVEFNVSATHIQWRYVGDSTWNDLVALEDLKGTDGSDGQDGSNGVDGKTPTFKVENGNLYVRYSDTEEWTLLGNIQGADGTDGADGSNGQDGKTPTFKVENDVLYVSYDNGTTWTELGNIGGADGNDGQDGSNGVDGKTPSFMVENGNLYVRYSDTEEWTLLGNIQGANGSDGADGSDGQDGVDGADGITPSFKIENGELKVSYDNGTTWVSLG
ncbi:MAG: InlB B-repeat-containing protein, partial [Lachnospiraceae bacterium]|nr:InlB B-repeat-containing protein [Lachnospiraceae bacterium]